MADKPAVEYAVSRTTHQTWTTNLTFDLFLTTSHGGSRSLVEHAQAGLAKEQKMTFRMGCRLYPKAVVWSTLLSCTIVMEAYDKSLMGSFYAFPEFRHRFGTHSTSTASQKDGGYELTTVWQTSLINAAIGAEILGLFFNGYLSDRFGYKRTMLGALLFMFLAIFVAFFATSLKVLIVSQVLCGLPWGVFQTLAAAYAAEVLPAALRPYLLGNINMCWLLGQLSGMGVVHGFLRQDSEWSFRIPLAIQWVWAILLLIGVIFAPEGPWWLMRHERVHDASLALRRLTRAEDRYINVDQMIAVMKHTDHVEKQLTQAGRSYIDCFKGTNLRRTELTCMVWLTQALCGATLTGYVAYFYEQAGFDTANSFKLATGTFGLAILGGVVSWALLPRAGRRTIYLGGLGILFALLLVGGVTSVAIAETDNMNWILGSLVIGFVFVYNITIGPICYTLLAELPSTRLRVKTVVLARVAYNVATIANNILAPLMLNPTAWNWKGKCCFYYAATALLCLIWCYFRLPETQGLAFVELDILFDRKAPTHKFKQFGTNLHSSGYLSLNQFERSASVWHGWRGYS